MVELPPITRIYRACDPVESVGPTDPRWVNLDAARGDYGVVQRIARELRRADPDKADVGLLSGHIGVGKTSALTQLVETLRADQPQPFLVVFANVGDSLDTNDLDFPDLLVFIAAEVQKEIRKRSWPGLHASTTLLKNVWDGIVALLGTEVALKSADAELGFVTLGLELRNQPTARVALRRAIEANQSSLLNAINDLLKTARVFARKNSHAGLVLIIDGLDRLSRVPLPSDPSTNPQERLFVDRIDQLAQIDALAVYAVPISLIYSPRFGQTQQVIGQHFPLLSMVALHEFDNPISAETVGMRAMREVIAKRCKVAGIEPHELFDERTELYLCELSGGHPRHLISLIRAACSASDALPLTLENIKQAVRNYGNSLLRMIPDEAWPVLRGFNEPQRDLPKNSLHLDALFGAWIFEYMNGEPWYEVNPVLRTLERFKPAT